MSTKLLLRLCISFVLVFIGICITKPAMAQGCAGVTILNESSQQLNTSAICEASMPWVNKNQGDKKHGVYIFATDAQIDNEEEWMAIRDRVEIGWGIYTNTQTITNNFVITAVVVSLTTDTNQPEGQDFGFGESLQDTGLVLAQPRIEAEMKQAVERGDVNGAITRALQNAYSFAYPAIIQATATSVPSTPRPTQVATLIPTQIPTRVIESTESSNAKGDSNPLGFIVGLLLTLLGSVGGYAGIKYGLPYLQAQSKLSKQVVDLKSRIPRLLNKSEEVFMNDELLSLWLGKGGKVYPEHTALVTQYINKCKEALNVAGLKWKENRTIQPRSIVDQQKLVKNLEIIYYSLVGKQPEVLNMSEEDQVRLFDPALDLPEVVEQSQLVKQLEDIEDFSQGKTLQVSQLMVDLDKMDQYGILGYIQLIKIMLNQLEKSSEVGPQLFGKATALREKLVTEINIPAEMSGVNIFEQVDFSIDEARTATDTQEWLTVQEASENALQGLEKLLKLMKDFSEILVHYRENQQKWQSLHDQGYNQITDSNEAMQETQEDFAKIIHAIVAGDDALYAEFANELFEDSRRAITLMKEQVALREKNEEKLVKLSQDVAHLLRIHADRTLQYWNELKIYPQSNWEEVSENFELSQQMLRSLFDNPDDYKDTASEIAALNSFQVQEFETAEKALVKAFAQMEEAEQLMEAIKHKLNEVKELETVVSTSISSVEGDLAKARSRRDSNATMVDASVDQIITEAETYIAEAKQLVTAKEYAKASDLINKVRILANQAVSSADEQIELIEHLLAGLQNLRQDMEGAYNQLQLQYKAIDLAARSEESDQLFIEVGHVYRRANQSERTFTTQDKALVNDIQHAIQLYQTVSNAIVAAQSQIQQDADQYQQTVNDVIEAIDEAEAAISRATDSVNNPNANGVGQHALQMARSLVPSYPPSGETYDALERRNDQALEAENRADEAKDLADDEVRRVRDQQAVTAALTTAVITSVIQHSRERRREESHSEPSQPRPQVKPSMPTPPIMGNSNTRSGSKPQASDPKMGNSKTR